MEVLYITSLWSGIRPLLFDGELHETGMPAFIRPLRHLVESGHSVTLLICSRRKEEVLKIGSPWLQNVDITFVHEEEKKLSGAQLKKRIQLWLTQYLKSANPDFIYLHGDKGAFLHKFLANKGIPCGQRVYGIDDSASRFKNKPNVWLKYKKPYLYESLTGKKEFVIITRDGSYGDQLQKQVCPNPEYDFYHELNGAEQQCLQPTFIPLSEQLKGRPYLFCPARFAVMKQKERILFFLSALHKLGHTQIRLKVAGQVSKQEEFTKFNTVMHELKLESYVDFLGTITRQEVIQHSIDALAMMSLYRFSNLSNVSIEGINQGSLLITLDDHSLKGLVDSTNAIIGPEEDLPALLNDLLQSSDADEAYRKLRFSMFNTGQRVFKTWDKRAEWEMSLIEKAVNP